MKRFKAILLCLVLTVMTVCAMGCDDKEKANALDEFIEVMSVTYQFTDKYDEYHEASRTLNSRLVFTYENYSEISYEEYCQLPKGPSNSNIARDKSNLKHDYKIGEFYAVQNYRDYYKCQLKSISEQYISVKVINDRSIYIKNHDGSIDYIASDYIKIEYFI